MRPAPRALALLLLVPVVLTAIPARALPTSIVGPNPGSPHVGQYVTFTSTYPKEARIKVGRQQQVNPDVQVDCYQAGVHVWSINNMARATEVNNGDGTYTGVSGQLQLGGTPYNEWTWVSGAASCSATLYYFGKDELIHTLAEVMFEVAA